MTEAWVVLSRENLPLAQLELATLLRALGGELVGPPLGPATPLVRFAHVEDVRLLAGRIALGRRAILRWPESDSVAIADRLRREIGSGESVAFRPAVRPTGRAPVAVVDPWAAAVRAAGGRIELDTPERKFLFVVDRAKTDSRRMPKLPFRRPVSLAPKLGRVAANLAGIRAGDRVIDPFVGTGALAIEVALVGGRVTGIDSDATMVQGALANFAHVGIEPEALVVGDARTVGAPGTFDALVTDPPYGRASTTGGEDATALTSAVVGRWAEHVRPDGRLVVVVPGGPDPVGSPWVRVASIPDRVHRSLTREFRVYEQAGGRAALPPESSGPTT
ncbi:MAG: methyltransferase domain-containing protein [Thermoplasmata archaeon]|nr:methyltransferase domain-containing protein [Thermoplasmata archaeon]